MLLSLIFVSFSCQLKPLQFKGYDGPVSPFRFRPFTPWPCVCASGCKHYCVCAGATETQKTIYLSPATLLVVPAVLIPHWLEQIQKHVRYGSLRYIVLHSGKAFDGCRGGAGGEVFAA